MTAALRSTPFRLAAALILVFALFLTAGLGAAYLVMHRTLAAGIEDRAEQVIDALDDLDEAEDVLDRAEALLESADTDELLLRVTAGGRSLGNLPDPRPLTGIVPGRLLSVEDRAESYLAVTRQLDEIEDATDGRVTVLVDREALTELDETFLAILGFSVLPALLLTSLIALLAVRRTGRRVEAIRGTLHAMHEGQLHARVGGPHPDTDLGDIARDLDRMAAAQEAATEALRQIGSDIAHDLKTPIQRVAVHLERLDAADLPPEARRALDAARSETTGIIGTFQSLLQIAQLEGGQGRDGFAPVDLGTLVRDMAEIYAPAVEEAGGTLSCRLTAPAAARGDRHLLARLIANLVENALRHAPGTAIGITLDGPRLTIRDGGPGIPAPRREDVLRRLVRLEASRSTPGSGLGLAMVKAIADLHGAELRLEDAPGGGLQVTLTFPTA